MSHALVRGLRACGADVRTALEEGMIERDDEEHLEFAAKANRVLYSFNVADFYQLHRRYLVEDKAHAGLILARQQQFAISEQLSPAPEADRKSPSGRDEESCRVSWGLGLKNVVQSENFPE